MPGFVADSLQTPLSKEAGDFVKIGENIYKLKGIEVSCLLAQGFMVTHPDEFDPRYPARRVFRLMRFTDMEQNAVRMFLEAGLRAQLEDSRGGGWL